MDKLQKLELSIDELSFERSKLSRVDSGSVEAREKIDKINNHILDCQIEYKKSTGAYYDVKQ